MQVQAEGLVRRYDAGSFNWDQNGNGIADAGELINSETGLPAVLSGETLTDYGGYAQLLYGFKKGWVAGLRADYVSSDPGSYESGNYTLNGVPVSSRDPGRAAPIQSRVFQTPSPASSDRGEWTAGAGDMLA